MNNRRDTLRDDNAVTRSENSTNLSKFGSGSFQRLSSSEAQTHRLSELHLCAVPLRKACGTLLLVVVGIQGAWDGPLLWPAAVLHSVLSVPLGLACLPARRAR
ncbi:MAG: hypothetical protein ACT4QC_19855 [Planctomycetaceae bacterium]